MLKRLISVLLILTLVLACMPVATAAGSLRIGSRGTEVTELQNALKELGLYSQKVDGVYGRGTDLGSGERPDGGRHCRAEDAGKAVQQQ